MQPEYEVHNFANTPRQYEAVYVFDGSLLVKVVIYQRDGSPRGGKPLLRWNAAAMAWTPGAEDDYIRLCHLGADEMTIRDIVPYEASADDWLIAAREDAEQLITRARVFAGVLAAGQKKATRR